MGSPLITPRGRRQISGFRGRTRTVVRGKAEWAPMVAYQASAASTVFCDIRRGGEDVHSYVPARRANAARMAQQARRGGRMRPSLVLALEASTDRVGCCRRNHRDRASSVEPSGSLPEILLPAVVALLNGVIVPLAFI